MSSNTHNNSCIRRKSYIYLFLFSFPDHIQVHCIFFSWWIRKSYVCIYVYQMVWHLYIKRKGTHRELMKKNRFFIFRIPIAFKCKWLVFANKSVRSEGRNGEDEKKVNKRGKRSDVGYCCFCSWFGKNNINSSLACVLCYMQIA